MNYYINRILVILMLIAGVFIFTAFIDSYEQKNKELIIKSHVSSFYNSAIFGKSKVEATKLRLLYFLYVIIAFFICITNYIIMLEKFFNSNKFIRKPMEGLTDKDKPILSCFVALFIFLHLFLGVAIKYNIELIDYNAIYSNKLYIHIQDKFKD